MAVELPEGLISIAELGVLAEYDQLEQNERQSELADLIIRMTGVIIRMQGGDATWTADNIPYEVKVVALTFARRVFNNPQNQQRIQTGPLGESYHPDELVGLYLTDSEEKILQAYTGGSGLFIQSVGRPDPLFPPRINYDLAMLHGLGLNDDLIRLPSLSKYLGVPYDGA